LDEFPESRVSAPGERDGIHGGYGANEAGRWREANEARRAVTARRPLP
jgi:hypothetical protein